MLKAGPTNHAAPAARRNPTIAEPRLHAMAAGFAGQRLYPAFYVGEALFVGPQAGRRLTLELDLQFGALDIVLAFLGDQPAVELVGIVLGFFVEHGRQESVVHLGRR